MGKITNTDIATGRNFVKSKIFSLNLLNTYETY